MPGEAVSEFFKRMFRRSPQLSTRVEHRCHTCGVSLEPEAVGPRLLNRCPECRGIWLSAAQLQEILEQVSHKANGELEAVEREDGHADIGNTFAPSRLSRRCPECGESMENYAFENSGIWIDGCPSAHGIWLDQGELKLLAQRRAATSDRSGTEEQGTVFDAVSDLILGTL